MFTAEHFIWLAISVLVIVGATLLRSKFKLSFNFVLNFMLVISVIFGVWALIDKIIGRALEGMTTVIIILIFIGSIMMISLGIIGYYVARIYEEIKGRPKYIISTTTNELKEEEEKDVKFYLINIPLIRQWFYFYKVGE